MNRGKLLQLRWVVQWNARQATILKRRANLYKKASKLSKLLNLPVAMVVFVPGEAESSTWPPAPAEVADILQGYGNMAVCAEDQLDLSIAKLRREEEMMKHADRAREVFIVLADIFSMSYQILDDLSDDLAANAMAVVELRKNVVSQRLMSLMEASSEPPMVPPPAMANQPPAADPPAATVLLVVWQ